jgi:hypothetical protein
VSCLKRFENLLATNGLKLMVKVKLYELLSTLILIDNEVINKAIAEKSFNALIAVIFMVNKVRKTMS